MCGILTYKGDSITTNSFRLALGKIANRGQDSWGIAFFHKKWGQWKLFQEEGIPYSTELPEFSSHIFTGNTRYPTIGSADLKPPYPYKNIVLSHNGNILNMYELSNREWDGDGQFIAWYLQKQIAKEGIVGGVKKFMRNVEGSYSISGIVDSEKIFAFRDPRGIRPLTFGKNKEGFAFASETLPLSYLGFKLEEIEPVKPGELIIIEEDVNRFQLFDKPHKHCAFEWVYFASPSSLIENKLVYNVRKKLGRYLEKILRSRNISDIKHRTEVPDTSRPAVDVMSLGERAEMIIRDRYISGRTFIMRSQKERKLKAQIKYNFNPLSNPGELLVVDDSIVRGTTMTEIVSTLKEECEGHVTINVASTYPPIRYPCYYGIDFASKQELIAANKTVKEIRKKIGADTLTYMTEEGLKKAIGLEDLCTACITGNYPTEKGKEIYENPKGQKRDYETS